MSHGSVSTGARFAPSALWAAAGGLAALLGVTLAAQPLALVGAAGGMAFSGAIALFAREPRWMLIATIVLLYSYAGWVLGHGAGASDVTMAVLPLLVVVLLVRHVLGRERLTLGGRERPLLALGAAWAVSAAFARDSAPAVARLAELVGWGALVLLMAALLTTPVWLRRALWAIALAAGALAAITVFQALTGAYDNTFLGFAKVDTTGSSPRSSGPLQPNNFAQILLVAAPIAWYLGLGARGRLERTAAYATAAVCILAVIYTGSRGGLVALVGIVVLVLVLAPVRRGRLLAGAGVGLALGVALTPSEYANRLQALTGAVGSGVTAADDGSLRGRASENYAALRMFSDHPLVGVGPANFPVRYQEYSQEIALDTRAAPRAPHSLYLEALAETGLIGAAGLLGVLWLAVRGPARARRRLSGADRLLAEGSLVGVSAYLIAAVFLHGAYPRYLWIVVGLGFAAGRLTGAGADRPAPGRTV